MGVFNLDLNFISTSTSSSYYGIKCHKNLIEFSDTHNLKQIVTEDTWFRNIKGTLKSSIIDHIYITENIVTLTPEHLEMAYSDHQLIALELFNQNMKSDEAKPIWIRAWHGYSKMKLTEKLKEESWCTDVITAQDHYNWLIEKLLHIVDELAPIKERKCVNSSSYNEENVKKLVYKHRRMVAK
jgi:hypothetical protein